MCASSRIRGVLVCFIALGCSLVTASNLLALDGSGSATVAPDSAAAGSTNNDFTFTYTADEDMGDGAVRMTTPPSWPNPTSGNTTVTVTNGATGLVIDSLDNNVVQTDTGGILVDDTVITPGWNSNDGVPLLDLTSVGTDSTEKIRGTASLEINYLLNLGLFSSTSAFWFNTSSALDWRGFQVVSFYIKASTALAAALDLGSAEFRICDGGNLTGTCEGHQLNTSLLSLALFSGGGWVQVVLPLDANTSNRDTVRSYGIQFPTVAVSVVSSINIDQLMAGPADPIFSGNTVTQNLIYLDDGGTVTFDYENVTTPNVPGSHEFPISTKVQSTGTLTEIADSPVIELLSETDCTDGNDGDGDGQIDCADADCASDPTCLPETNCTNGLDDDSDTNIDCDDSDCASNPACIESNCSDGNDNDGDGETDCDDDDCTGNAACVPETNCTNGLDDDSDNDVDCADSDCDSNPACIEHNCVDGVDNDGDGATDCADTNCANTPACPDSETSCNNEIDDDRDGPVDCADSDCAANPACTDPDDDDDGDGVPNGDDNCVTVPNPDQADRDGDGIGDACDNIINQDVDDDGGDEQAHDQNNDQCFGDLYFDPDGSSDDCIRTDGNNDQCADFFIDTNGDGCTDRCPELYWNPSDGILDKITERQVDTDGDGDTETVCAYDSDGDGEDDSFVETSPTGPAVGGTGGGGTNPFALSGTGCNLAGGGMALPWASFGLLGLGLLGLRQRSRK